MGTSGAYTGAGGKAGRDITAGTEEWIDSLPGGSGTGRSPLEPEAENQPSSDLEPDISTPGADRHPTELPPRLVSGALALLRPRSTRGPGGGGAGGAGGHGAGGGGAGGEGGNGLRRSSTALARSAGRAGAAAYAYTTGDRAGLSALRLDFDSLRSLGDPIEVIQRIVDAACGQLSGGSLESHEERYVAASVAEWVLEQSQDGSAPSPEEIARHSIAVVVAEVVATEINESLGRQPDAVAALAEAELIQAAEILADRAELSVNGATPEELSRAIEEGIETLRQIYGGSP